jgi:predicted ArsR family transcriptional regulator
MRIEQLHLDPTVDWLPMPQAAEILEVHPSQVRRDRAVLEELELISYNQRSNGFNREVFEVLWRFRKLVRQRGRIEAIAAIVNLGESHE